MNGFVLAAKAAALLSDQNVRKRFGWTLVIILSPIIVVLAFILSLASGSASHNTAAVELCFNGGVVPAQMPAEYRSYIEEMRDSFLTLDQYLESINGMTEGGKSVDTVQVKADFYALFFGDEQPGRRAVSNFADCFVTYEKRTRTITNDDGTTSEESYTVAIPIEDPEIVWEQIKTTMGIEITAENRINAQSIYNLIQYGGSGSGSLDGIDIGGPVMSVDGFCSPLGANWRSMISSDFGYRICPYHGRELHSGLDLAAPAGTSIRAALSGTVVKSYYSNSYGNYTVIDHGNGMTTAYAHQSKRLVSVGDTVNAGEVIGLVGSTGNSTGPHLHFEVRVDGNLQDPKLYLP